MPEEVKTQEPVGDKGPQPGIDADSIREAVASALSDWTPPEPKARPDVRPQPSSSGKNPLVDVVMPIVEPAMRLLDVAANDARDAALFYVEHQDALPYKKDLEKASDALKTQGTPFTREALWDWYRGKNFKQFHDLENKKQTEAADRATREAAMVGPGSPNRDSKPAKDPHTMTDEELTKSLEGVAF